jgi:hypothetical protein
MAKVRLIVIVTLVFAIVVPEACTQSNSGNATHVKPDPNNYISPVDKAISFFADLADAYKKAVIDPVQSVRLQQQNKELGEKLKKFSEDLRAIRDMKESLRTQIQSGKVPTAQDWQKIVNALGIAKTELAALRPYYPDGVQKEGDLLNDVWFDGFRTKAGLFNEVQSDAARGQTESASKMLIAGENLQAHLAECVDAFRDQVIKGAQVSSYGTSDAASVCRKNLSTAK